MHAKCHMKGLDELTGNRIKRKLENETFLPIA